MTSMLSAPRLSSNHPIQRILEQKRNASSNLQNISGIHWPAEFWNLHKVSLFQQLKIDRQNSILKGLSDSLIHESYFIEKGAMQMMSRFSVEACSTEERILYSLFSAEEARHFLEIAPFFNGKEEDCQDDTFLMEMAQISTDSSKVCATYMLQVILEGWGLWHYKRLSTGTTSPDLKKVFDGILRDEASHHGAGIIVSKEQSNELAGSVVIEDEIITHLRTLLKMIRVGPLRVIGFLSLAHDGLATEKITTILNELQALDLVNFQLELIEKLIRQGPLSERILKATQDLLRPSAINEMSAIGLLSYPANLETFL